MDSTEQRQKAVQIHVDGIKDGVTKEILWAYFTQFGEVLNVILYINPLTNICSGNGLITLRPRCDVSTIPRTLHTIPRVPVTVLEHISDELRQSDAASAQSNTTNSAEQPQEAVQIYVDGVKGGVTKEILWAYFTQFGEVMDVQLYTNPPANTFCGNGLITLRPTCDVSTIPRTLHAIPRVPMPVLEHISHGFGQSNAVSFYFTKGMENADGLRSVLIVPIVERSSVKDEAQPSWEWTFAPDIYTESHSGAPPQLTAIDSRLLCRVCRTAESAQEPQRVVELYVDGVKGGVTEETLRTYFAHFGEVLDVFLYKNPLTYAFCGNGLITLRPNCDVSNIPRTLHTIHGVPITVTERVSDEIGQADAARDVSSTLLDGIEQPRRVVELYVDGVKDEVTREDLRSYFAQIGGVLDVSRFKRPSRNRPYGNTLITLRPKCQMSTFLHQTHSIRGYPITVVERVSDRDVQTDSMRDASSNTVNCTEEPKTVLELCVDGVDGDITADALRDHFVHFGEVLDVSLFKSPSTGSARGRGLIKLRPTCHVATILCKTHNIRGYPITVVERASEGNRQSSLSADTTSNTVDFTEEPRSVVELCVDGVKGDITAKALRNYFAQFGEVLDVSLFKSPSTDSACGNGLVKLRPTCPLTNFLYRSHNVHGYPIAVVKRGSKRNQKIKSSRSHRKGKCRVSTIIQKHSGMHPDLNKAVKRASDRNQQCDSVRDAPSTTVDCVEQPRKVVELYVDGMRNFITAEELRTYFLQFGDVLDVSLFQSPLTDCACGRGLVKLRPTCSMIIILYKKHHIRGYPITVVEYALKGTQQSISPGDAPSTIVDNAEEPKTVLELYVDGVDGDITVDALRNHFGQFGEVLDVSLFKSPSTDSACGRGLIRLHPTCQAGTILCKTHNIRGYAVTVVEYALKGNRQPKSPVDAPSNTAACLEQPRAVVELYVDGLRNDVTTEEVRAYFGQFGKVLDVFPFKRPSIVSAGRSSLITLRPKCHLPTILHAKHSIRGDPIAVVKRSSDGNGKTDSASDALSTTGNCVGQPRRVVELFVDGMKDDITVEALRTHFAQFGDVLEVFQFKPSSTNRYCGNTLIILRPKCNVPTFLHEAHKIRGCPITVVKRVSDGNQQSDLASAESDTMGCAEDTPTVLKLSVDGIKARITVEMLRDYFGQFGEVLDVFLYTTPVTHIRCGNGIITLRPTSDVATILNTQHCISGASIHVFQLAYDGNQPGEAIGDAVQIYVDGIRAGVTVEILRNYYAQFGELLDVFLYKIPFTDITCGNGIITLRPKVDVATIPRTLRCIRGALPKAVQRDSEGNRQSASTNDAPSTTANSVDQQRKAVKLYVDGVRADITAETLRTYFKQFGEVLDVTLHTHPSTKRACGNGLITLRPTCVVATILNATHRINGGPITVAERASDDTEQIDAMRFCENLWGSSLNPDKQTNIACVSESPAPPPQSVAVLREDASL